MLADVGYGVLGSPRKCRLRCRAVDFLIMEGQNLSAVAPAFVPFGGALGSARQAWVIIAALIMLPTVYFRNMGLLAYLSAAGVLTSLSLTCLVGTIAAEHGEVCHLTAKNLSLQLSSASSYGLYGGPQQRGDGAPRDLQTYSCGATSGTP